MRIEQCIERRTWVDGKQNLPGTRQRIVEQLVCISHLLEANRVLIRRIRLDAINISGMDLLLVGFKLDAQQFGGVRDRIGM